ncbi:hypothetical protein [Massilia niastensis]|uniref:hypothetical protein n=1 Tax=Massilia niastensis TaxID=544911 RepID=UPI0003697EEF|nr:hypothetical protein [Massilia niastensis]
MTHAQRAVRGVLACVLGMAACAAQAQTGTAGTGAAGSDAAVEPIVARQQAREIAQGDPARWYRDDSTRQARLQTLQKEIGAALKEAQAACKKRREPTRSACLQEARATWRQDMAQARSQVDSQ